MTCNVFGGMLNLAQSISYIVKDCVYLLFCSTVLIHCYCAYK